MKNYLLVALLFTSFHVYAQPASFNVQGIYPGLYVNHTLSEGQTFLSLARTYNLSPNAIAKFNGLGLSANLQAGSVLKIPATTTNLQRMEQSNNIHSSIPLVYSPSDAENIYSLSKRFGIPDTTIQKINFLTDKKIKPGSSIVIGFIKIRKDAIANLSVVDSVSPKTITNKPAPIAGKPEPAAAKTEQAVAKPEQAVAKSDPVAAKPEPTKVPISPAITSRVDTTVATFKDENSDELFEQARHAAFDQKNYTLALGLCKLALAKSPDYSDIRVFAGRIYTWTDRIDSAIRQFDYVVQHDVENKEVYVAYSDLLYWNDKNADALAVCDKGLIYYPTSKDLQIRKAKILKALKRPAEAQLILEKLLSQDRGNAEARALVERTKDEVLRNKIGFSYDYTYFDKQFSDPWHIGSLDYSRQTNLGSIGGHINYANRFRSSALQYELEAYPHISKRFYSYVGAAYSKDAGVFPKYRGGFSLYALLPKSMEGELGFRYLYFSSSTMIYTAAIGKYVKSWLFTARTYLTPGNNNISQSYNLTARYYYGGADDYYTVTIGHGISPDDKPISILLNKEYPKLVSSKAAVGYKHEFKRKYILTLVVSWVNQEYRPNTKGNQFSSGISLQMRF